MLYDSVYMKGLHRQTTERESKLVVAVGYRDCEEQGVTTNWVSFWGDENVRKLEYGDGCELQLISLMEYCKSIKNNYKGYMSLQKNIYGIMLNEKKKYKIERTGIPNWKKE